VCAGDQRGLKADADLVAYNDLSGSIEEYQTVYPSPVPDFDVSETSMEKAFFQYYGMPTLGPKKP